MIIIKYGMFINNANCSPSIDTRINPMMPLLNEMRHAQSTKTLKYHRSPDLTPAALKSLFYPLSHSWVWN